MGQIRQGISENAQTHTGSQQQLGSKHGRLELPSPIHLILHPANLFAYILRSKCMYSDSTVQTLLRSSHCLLKIAAHWCSVVLVIKTLPPEQVSSMQSFQNTKKQKQTLTCKWCLVTVVLYSDFSMARYYIAIGKRIIYIGNSLVPINISDDTCRSKNWIPLQLIFKITYSLPLKRGVLTLLFNHAGCQLILPHNTL